MSRKDYNIISMAVTVSADELERGSYMFGGKYLILCDSEGTGILCAHTLFQLCRLHTAFLHWPLSSAATKEIQGPDTT